MYVSFAHQFPCVYCTGTYQLWWDAKRVAWRYLFTIIHLCMRRAYIYIHMLGGVWITTSIQIRMRAYMYTEYICVFIYACTCVPVCVLYIDSDGIRISIRMLLINDTGVALVMNWGYGDDILPHTHSYIPTKRRTYISVKRHTRCISYHIYI